MTERRVEALPAGAELLGYAGLVPFAALCGGLLIAPDPAVRATLERALLAYGCAILSFVGAVHWGLAIGGGRRRMHAPLALLVGVVPASAGAVSVVLPTTYGLGLQVVAFAAFWLYEHRSPIGAGLPAPYLRLRRVLTLVVLAILVAALFGPVGGALAPVPRG